ncbi:MAG TPA: hypothetical protein VM737_02710 [Gemmatimonadota bacterium]|nr:hypothetical protein [Gemmatimonadota bacterium]
MRALSALLWSVLAAGCVVYDSGPVGPDSSGRPFVEGRWDIDAFVSSSTCGFVGDEPFSARVFQNRDRIQFVVDIAGFGDLRYDGFLERDGDFFVRHTTFFPEADIRDSSQVDGRFSFSGRSLTATEVEEITDLRTGRTCRIVWRWRGDRR